MLIHVSTNKYKIYFNFFPKLYLQILFLSLAADFLFSLYGCINVTRFLLEEDKRVAG